MGPEARELAALVAALVALLEHHQHRATTRAASALLMTLEWVVRVVRHYQAAPAGSLLLCDSYQEPKEGQGGAAGLYTAPPQPAAPPPALAPQLAPVHLALASAALDALEELADLDKHLGLAELYAQQVDDDLHTGELKNDLQRMRLAMVGLTGRMAELTAPLTGTSQASPPLAHAAALATLLRASQTVAAGAEGDRFALTHAARAFNHR